MDLFAHEWHQRVLAALRALPALPAPGAASHAGAIQGSGVRGRESGVPVADPPSPVPRIAPADTLDGPTLRALFESQVKSRWLDIAARVLRAHGQGYYTIASAGHEGNVVLGRLTRPTDPALLHYRSGALFLERLRATGRDAVEGVLYSLAAAAADPVCQGRHKVWGSRAAWVLPQTSTIASHLPRAVGMASAIEWVARNQGQGARGKGQGDFGFQSADFGLRPSHAGGNQQSAIRNPQSAPPVPADAIVLCSFGDASVNHSTAAGAFNAARLRHFRGEPLPLLFVCEDNGLGISVPTPAGWIEDAFSGDDDLEYFDGDGCNLHDAWRAAAAAVAFVRTTRRPAFLHLRMVRIGGHAGSDVESGYRDPDEHAAALARDPLPATARLLVEGGVIGREEVIAQYLAWGREIEAAMERVAGAPQLADAAAVMAPLGGGAEDGEEGRSRKSEVGSMNPKLLHSAFRVPTSASPPLTLAQGITATLAELLASYPEAIIFGEDVGKKGGVYGVTKGLQKRFGPERVFDTPLDETHIIGLALGFGVLGALPCPEIQYLAYVYNAIDQLRGEACSQQFFSAGQFGNPMVLRVQGLAYQQGFGGHFHNDNGIGGLREIPGVVILCPARADDAAELLAGAFAFARATGRVVVVIEPIALYHTQDLYEPGDGRWLAARQGATKRERASGLGLRASDREGDTARPLPERSGGREPRQGSPGGSPSPLKPEAWSLKPEDTPHSTLRTPHSAIFRPRVYDEHQHGRPDLTILTFANGLYRSLCAARTLAAAGASVRVVDLRCLWPLDAEALAAEVAPAGRTLIVDECRRAGGIADALYAALCESGTWQRAPIPVPLARVTGRDSYVPLGPAADLVLVQEADILAAARELLARPAPFTV